jgi:APA family basic amino acid/polyamine antiporter
LTEEVKVELFLRKATGLVKEIGPAGAFIIPWATMAGSGITFYSISVSYSYPNGSVPLAFLIVGVPTILNAIILALMSVCTPRSAGGYVWSTRFVDPILGWFGSGWIYWLSYIFTVALVSYVMATVYSTIFSIMGAATGIVALSNLGSLLATNTAAQMGLIFAIIIVVGLVSLLELKYYMKILYVIWALNTLGLIVSIILFAINTPSTIPTRWDAVWGSGSYNAIINLAAKYDSAGYVAKTSTGMWGDTLGIVAYIFWAITGYESLAYVAGEVRNPRSSFLKWFMAGMVATVLWYAVASWLAYNTYGDFIFKYNYVYQLHSSGALTAADDARVSSFMFSPCMPLFSSSLAGSSVLQVVAAWWFWPINVAMISYLVATRSIFGMAFDRMFPAVFGQVSERTHTPVYATLFNIVMSLIWAAIMFTSFGYLVSAANTSFWTAMYYFIYSLAAMALPYKRPEIWEKGLKKKIFGVPELTLLGAFSAAGMLWILSLSTLGISLLAWNVSTLWMLIGILIVVYYVYKNEKRGIKVMDIYKEIPPP